MIIGRKLFRGIRETDLIAGPPYVWYKADTLNLEDGDTVATWTDSSGNNRDAFQIAAPGQRPVFKRNIVNACPIIRFDGVDDFLNIPTISGDGPWTHFVIYKKSLAADTFLTFSSNDTSGLPYTFFDYFDSIMYSGSKTGAFFKATGGRTTFTVVTIIMPAGASGYLSGRLRVNRVEQTGLTTAAGASSANFIYLGTRVHNAGANTDWTKGDIAEIIHYTSVLSESEIAKVENYLAAKYSIS